MPKNLIIYGSPSQKSFTAKLLEAQKKELNGSVTLFDCFTVSPTPCNGCGLCKVKDGCRYGDLDAFFEDFEKADNIIIAFPIYNNSFPAPLKALIDRFQRFYNARFTRNIRPPIKGKRDVTLIMSQGSSQDILPIILAQLEPVFTICGCQLKKTVLLTGTDALSPDDSLTPTVTYY